MDLRPITTCRVGNWKRLTDFVLREVPMVVPKPSWFGNKACVLHKIFEAGEDAQQVIFAPFFVKKQLKSCKFLLLLLYLQRKMCIE